VIALGEYISQSANVSLQIGLMRLLGYEVPECFNYPWLARSPMDFWRRWNRYLGVWCERYIYTPTALSVARKLRKRGTIPIASGIFAAFVAMGVLHDLAVYTRDATKVPFALTALFVTHGVVLLAWELVARGLGSIGLAFQRAVGARRHIYAFVGWAVFSNIMAATLWMTLRWQ
jgi:hypothetical protein